MIQTNQILPFARNATWVLAASILMVIAGCKSDGLPDSPPDGLMIEMHYDGGMTPNSYSIKIGQDSSFLTEIRQGENTVIGYKSDPERWQELYNIIRENEFHKIVADRRGEVVDRDGTSITVRYKSGEESISYHVSNAGSHFVREVWDGNYTNVEKAILTFNSKGVAPFYRDIEILMTDETEKLLEGDFYLDGKRQFTFPQDTTARRIRIFPGTYDCSITATRMDQQVDEEKYITITNETKGIYVTFLEDSLDITLK